MWRWQRLLPRGECIRNGEYRKDKDRRVEWWTKVGSVNPEMGCLQIADVSDVGRIHPRTNREGLTPFHHSNRDQDVSTPGMEPASLQK